MVICVVGFFVKFGSEFFINFIVKMVFVWEWFDGNIGLVVEVIFIGWFIWLGGV